MRIRLAAVAIGITMLGAFGAATPAQAAITTTNITAPTNSFPVARSAGDRITVTGTTDSNSNADTVDIVCSAPQGVAKPVSGQNVAVDDATDTFTVDVNPNEGLAYFVCDLHAVPDSGAFNGGGEPASAFTGFSGPRLGTGYVTPVTVSGGPNDGQTEGFSAAQSALEGYHDLQSLGRCPIRGTFTIDPASLFYSDNQYTCVAGLLGSESAELLSPSVSGTRAGLQVDGRDAFAPQAAATVGDGSTAPGWTGIEDLALTHDPANGLLSSSERNPILRCPDASVWPHASSDGCTDFLPTGVAADVTTRAIPGATQTIEVAVAFRSTDGAAHAIDAQFKQYFDPAAAEFRLPGETAFTARSGGTAGAAPATGPGTAFVQDLSAAENPRAALTWSSPPNALTFVSAREYFLSYSRTVPATGATTFKFILSLGPTQGGLDAAAAATETRLKPSVTVDAPVGVFSASPATITGTVTDDLADGRRVTVNGSGASVANGRWTASVPLTEGANTLNVVATDADGNTASTTTTATLKTPSTPPVKPSNAFTIVGKAKKNRNGSFTITVKAPGPGAFTATGKAKTGKTGKTRRTAVTSAKAKAGKSGRYKLTLRLNKKGKKALKAAKAKRGLKTLKVSIALTFKPTGGDALTKTIPTVKYTAKQGKTGKTK